MTSSHRKSTRFGELTAVKYLTLMILAVYVFSFTVLACTMKKLREELTRALIEAKDGSGNGGGGIQGTLDSFNELVKEVTSKRQDIKAFAFKAKAMVNGTSFSGVPFCYLCSLLTLRSSAFLGTIISQMTDVNFSWRNLWSKSVRLNPSHHFNLHTIELSLQG